MCVGTQLLPQNSQHGNSEEPAITRHGDLLRGQEEKRGNGVGKTKQEKREMNENWGDVCLGQKNENG